MVGCQQKEPVVIVDNRRGNAGLWFPSSQWLLVRLDNQPNCLLVRDEVAWLDHGMSALAKSQRGCSRDQCDLAHDVTCLW